jgi:long-chain fatty acid transport protein
VNYQTLDAELTNKVNGVALNPGFAGQEFDAKLEGDDDAFGWNAGVLFNVTDAARIGVSYRSTLEYTLEGDLSITTAGGTSLLNVPVTADITMPDSFSVSAVSALSDRLELLGDVTLTRWSEIQNLKVVDNTGAQREDLVLKFDDSYRISVGANYKWNDQLTWKVGLAYDQSPVDDQYRTVRLPDNDRTWVSVGAKYKVGNGVIDAGYSHLFVSDASIDQDRGNALGYGRVAGTYESSIDILSVQYSVGF